MIPKDQSSEVGLPLTIVYEAHALISDEVFSTILEFVSRSSQPTYGDPRARSLVRTDSAKLLEDFQPGLLTHEQLKYIVKDEFRAHMTTPGTPDEALDKAPLSATNQKLLVSLHGMTLGELRIQAKSRGLATCKKKHELLRAMRRYLAAEERMNLHTNAAVASLVLPKIEDVLDLPPLSTSLALKSPSSSAATSSQNSMFGGATTSTPSVSELPTGSDKLARQLLASFDKATSSSTAHVEGDRVLQVTDLSVNDLEKQILGYKKAVVAWKTSGNIRKAGQLAQQLIDVKAALQVVRSGISLNVTDVPPLVPSLPVPQDVNKRPSLDGVRRQLTQSPIGERRNAMKSPHLPIVSNRKIAESESEDSSDDEPLHQISRNAKKRERHAESISSDAASKRPKANRKPARVASYQIPPQYQLPEVRKRNHSRAETKPNKKPRQSSGKTAGRRTSLPKTPMA